MSSLDRSDVWRHLSRALAQLAPVAEGGSIPPADRTRALEHLALVSQANSTLLERKELTRYEARLIDFEIARLRARLDLPATPPAGRLGQPDTPAIAQGAFDRLHKIQSALSRMAESGECHREVLKCVQRGLKLDLATLSNAQHVATLPDELRRRVPDMIRETQRCVQTISVQQEIQAAAATAPLPTPAGVPSGSWTARRRNPS